MSEPELKVQNNVNLFAKFLYGFGGMFCYTLAGRFGLYYRMFFLTDVAKLPTELAATTYSSSTLIGIIATLLAGVIVDSTNLKWGKYRSWIIIGFLGTFLTSALTYYKMETVSPVVYCAYLIFMGAFNTLLYQLGWCAYRALVGPMSITTEDQVGLSSASSLGMQAAGFVAGPVLLGVMNFWTAKNLKQGYMLIQFTLSLLYLVSLFTLNYLAKKYEKPIGPNATKEEKAKNKTSLKDIVKNIKGPMIPYFLASIVTNTYSGFFSALLAYYTTYYLGNPGATAMSQTYYSVGSIIGVLVTPKICAAFGMKRTYCVSLLLCSVSFVVLIFIPASTVVFYVVRAVNGLLQAPSVTAMVAMANDIADNAEMHGEKGARAFTQSIMGAAINIGFMLSATISSFGLAAIGYQQGTVPDATMVRKIAILMAAGPAVATAGGAIIMLFFNIDEKALTEYRVRRAAAQKAAEEAAK